MEINYTLIKIKQSLIRVLVQKAREPEPLTSRTVCY